MVEITGTVAQDIDGALAEFDAIAAGTRAREGVYAAFINPPQPLSREQFMRAVALIEERLGLAGQPRVILFHTKAGRLHCHAIWSRIDIKRMRAIQLSHDRQKLRRCAQELAAEFGTPLPPGLREDRRAARFDQPKQPTKAEIYMAENSGITIEERRAAITACYSQADSAQAFVNALEAAGYILAKGESRAFVVVDMAGDVHALARQIEGAKTRDVKAKLEGLDLSQLPTVERAKILMLQRAAAQQEAVRAAADEIAETQAEAERRKVQEKARRAKEDALAAKQATRRLEVRQAEQQFFTRQQEERLALHAAQISESRGVLFRIRSAVVGLIGRMPGLRSVLSHIQKMTHLDPKERHRLENEALARRHAREKRDIERRRRALARLEARERQSLEKAAKRERRLQEAACLAESRDWEEGELQQEFDTAAGFDREVQETGDDALAPDWREGDLRQRFGTAAGLHRDDEDSGDGGDGPAPNGDEDSDGNDKGPEFRPPRGKGYGYR
jgi:Relaxase/Mobilisation nuclease domain